MKVELDFPPADLFPNRKNGKHWAVTHGAKTTYRELCGWLTQEQVRKTGWKPREGDIELHLTFEMPDKRWRDADNCLAAAKAGLDGFADALGVNDRHFQPIVIRRVLGAKPGKLIVEIKENT